jgi:hypothetical protein
MLESPYLSLGQRSESSLLLTFGLGLFPLLFQLLCFGSVLERE